MEVQMPTVIYNDYMIVAVAKLEKLEGCWCVCVDISSRDAGRTIRSFEMRHEVETQAQAEDCGLNLACAWIDQQIKPLPALERNPPVAADTGSGVGERELRDPLTAFVGARGELRTEVREFAGRLEEILRQDEKKRNDSWTKAGMEQLVHVVLDNISALLMTNYNDDSHQAALQDTCLDLATLAFIIRRKSMRWSKTQSERLAEQADTGPQVRPATAYTKHASGAEKRERKRGAVRQLRPKDPSLLER
jgi:hypothetical protein